MRIVIGHNKGQFLSSGQKAEELGISSQLVRRWAKSGQINAIKQGRDWLVEAMVLPKVKFLRKRKDEK